MTSSYVHLTKLINCTHPSQLDTPDCARNFIPTISMVAYLFSSLLVFLSFASDTSTCIISHLGSNAERESAAVQLKRL